MSILDILKAVLSLASSLSDFARDKQLLDAGEARGINAYLEKSKGVVSRGIEARRAARLRPLDADGDGVHDDDGFRRD